MEQHAGAGVEHREAGDANQRRTDAHRASAYEKYRPAHGRDKKCDPPPAPKDCTNHDQSRDHCGFLSRLNRRLGSGMTLQRRGTPSAS
jgi:hypothetical protein